MKVLKKGREQKGWAGEFRCTGAGNGDGGCNAMLLVEQADLFKTYHSDYTGDKDTYHTFRCSECGVNTDLKGIPGAVSTALPAGVGHPSGGWCRQEELDAWRLRVQNDTVYDKD